MKIAYIYDAVYPWVKGGAEKRIYEIGKRLADRGHEVHWFGLNWWNGEKDIVKDGIHIHGIGKWDKLYVDGKRSIKEGLYFGLKTLTSLKGDFDVVDCQEFPYFSCLSARIHSLLKRSEFFITWHEVWRDYWFQYLGKKGFFGYIVEILASRIAKKHIAVSENTKKDLEAIGVKNVKVIPNGIDFERIQKIKPADEESDVLFVGRLIKEKKVDVLIKAIRLIKKDNPSIKCLIIGDGPERSKLEKLVDILDLSKNVKFKGFLENHDDVISLMKASKVFVLPSIREGFGIAAIEANACGLPVVTVKHERNAVANLINDKNGFLCKLSEEEIKEKIILALNEADRMKRECIEAAKMYDWDKIVDLVELTYKEGCDESERKGFGSGV